MRNIYSALSVLALLLAGCSGGSGDPVGTLPLVSHTNLEVVRAVMTGPDIADFGEDLANLPDQLDFTAEGTFGCPGGGSYSVDLQGDPPHSGTIAFHGCRIDFQGQFTEVYGTIDFKLLANDGVAFSVDLDAFDGNEKTELRGDMTIVYPDADPDYEEVILRGSSFAVTEGGVTHSLKDYRFEESVHWPTGTYVKAMDGYLQSSSMQGSVYCVTTDPLTGTGDGPPSGDLELLGADESRILVMLRGETIHIAIDEDGDGIYEDTISTSRSALLD